MALRFKRKKGQGFWVGDAFVRIESVPGSGRTTSVAVFADPDVPVYREEIDGRTPPDMPTGDNRGNR